MPFFFPLLATRTGERGGGARRQRFGGVGVWRRLGVGEKGAVGCGGIDSPAHLGSGRSEEAGQREQAAVALAVAALEALGRSGLWRAGMRGLRATPGPIYSGGEAVGRPSVAVAGRCGRWPVRRVQRGAIMAFRPLAAVMERRTRRGGT